MLRIEKLEVEYAHGFKYILSMEIDRQNFFAETPLIAVVDLHNRRGSAIDYVQEHINLGIEHLSLHIKKYIEEQAQEVFRRNGDFDSTSRSPNFNITSTADILRRKSWPGPEEVRAIERAVPDSLSVNPAFLSTGTFSTANQDRYAIGNLATILDRSLVVTSDDEDIAVSNNDGTGMVVRSPRSERVGMPYNFNFIPWTTSESISSSKKINFRMKKATPDRKAKSLLYRKIGHEKARQLKRDDHFTEVGKYGKYIFHLNTNPSVTFLQEIKIGATKVRTLEWELCVQSAVADMPIGDVVLARWLAFKADEDAFLNTANFRDVETKDEAFEDAVGVIERSIVSVLESGSYLGSDSCAGSGDTIVENEYTSQEPVTISILDNSEISITIAPTVTEELAARLREAIRSYDRSPITPELPAVIKAHCAQVLQTYNRENRTNSMRTVLGPYLYNNVS